MLAELFNDPDDYLDYFNRKLNEKGIFETYSQLSKFSHELQDEFKKTYYNEKINQFSKWGNLLTIDAQLQILLELLEFKQIDIIREYKMSEEDIIQLIKRDCKTYYRELTGKKIDEIPDLGLIYLSEE